MNFSGEFMYRSFKEWSEAVAYQSGVEDANNPEFVVISFYFDSKIKSWVVKAGPPKEKK